MTSNESILGFKFVAGKDEVLSVRCASSMTVDEGSKTEEEGNGEPLLWNDSALSSTHQEEYSDVFQEKCLNIEYGGVQYLQQPGYRRYLPSLKHLIPVRRKQRKKESLGVDQSGLWSFITVSWLTRFLVAAYKKRMSVDDIPTISPYDSCQYNVERLEFLWRDELAAKGPKDASFVRVAWRFMRTRLIVSAFVFSLSILISFVGVTVVMRKLLEFAENPDAPYMEGLAWALGLTLYELLRSVSYSITWIINFRTATRIRAACLALMYKKLLRLTSLGDNSVGEMINIFSLDGQRMFELVLFIPLIISGPIVVILGGIYIWWILSPWALVGFSSFFLFYPLQYALSRLQGYMKGKSVGIIDERLNKMSEILHSIKLIKMNVWERLFANSLNDIRERELSYIKKNMYCVSFSSSLSATVPYISAMLTFLAHIAAGHTLTASQGFSVVAMMMSLLRSNKLFSKKDLCDVYHFITSFHRFKRVLLLNETSIYWSKPLNKTLAVSITNGTFQRYSSSPQTNKLNGKVDEKLLSADESGPGYVTILTDINFFVPKGKLVGICGEVGSGKSCLLTAVLGQMKMIEGKICREGSCAYAAQQPWLINASLKQNIVFGEKFNSEKYFRAVYSSCLNKDISEMPGGDETEIGERGINLSGGQKQRVSLARALYADRDIYLLDDPLSQVDATVRETLMTRYIHNALHGKTVLLVTHNLDCLKKCDGIVVMKDGKVVERGTHDELMVADGEYRSMVDLWTTSKLTVTRDEAISPIEEPPEIHLTANGTKKDEVAGGRLLISEEKRQSGGLKTETIISYASACGGACITLSVILLMLFNIGSTAFSNWWLALWLKASNGTASLGGTVTEIPIVTMKTTSVNQTVLDLIETTESLNESALETTDSLIETTTLLATTLVDNVTDSLVGSSLSSTSLAESLVPSALTDDKPDHDFTIFYTVYAASVGVILFSNLLRGFCLTNVSLRAARVLHNKLFDKMLYAPLQFFETTPIGRIQNLFSKDTEDIETRLPQSLELLLNHSWQIIFSLLFISLVFPWFIVPLACVALLYHFISKVFRVGMRDIKRLEASTRSPIFSTVTTTVLGLDTIHAFNKEQPFYHQFSTMFNVNSVCLLMMAVGGRWLSIRLESLAAVIMLVTGMLVVVTHGQVSAAMAGLALAYASSVSSLLQYITRLLCEVEVKLLAVERINMYIADIREEGSKVIAKRVKPSATWPDKGTIVFKSVSLRYRTQLPFVLKDISFKINSREKIGIVGRSGSGKSSLVTALLRFVEISSGQILIDRVDISSLELSCLRSKISVIPQDPTLLSGTLRYNLDPMGKVKDAELWLALEKAKLKSKVESMEGGLDATVCQGGDNLSVGERQLLCLARAICRRSSIVILDEATSGVDHETETTVMEAVRTQLADCTVLTIAHRLETLTNSNRVMVIDDGQVCEFGPPSELLEKPDSMFSRLIKSSSRVSERQ